MPSLREGEKLICPRCLALLLTYAPNSLHRTAAYAFAFALLFADGIAGNLIGIRGSGHRAADAL